MSKPLNWMQLQDIRLAVEEVERELEAVPDFGQGNDAYKARQQYYAALIKRLAGIGLTLRDNWNGGVASMHGIRATSTMGVNGALRNWRTAARKRLPGQVAA